MMIYPEVTFVVMTSSEFIRNEFGFGSDVTSFCSPKKKFVLNIGDLSISLRMCKSLHTVKLGYNAMITVKNELSVISNYRW